jgi:uncharacterized protein YlzI (FlbEa/FlbD family)
LAIKEIENINEVPSTVIKLVKNKMPLIIHDAHKAVVS